MLPDARCLVQEHRTQICRLSLIRKAVRVDLSCEIFPRTTKDVSICSLSTQILVLQKHWLYETSSRSIGYEIVEEDLCRGPRLGASNRIAGL